MDFFAVIIFSVATGHELYVAGPYTSAQCAAEIKVVGERMAADKPSLSCVSEAGLDTIAAKAKANECHFVTSEKLSDGVTIAGFACK